jgi:opacity protein-like surface antigen
MKVRFAALGLTAALALPAAALAQAAPLPAFIIVPHVGATTAGGAGASFSGTVGVKAGAKMTITGEFGQMINILPASVNEQVETEAALVANAKGGKHSSSASADATYGMVGLRWRMRDVSGAQTFLELGGGMAHVTSDVSAQIRGSEALQGDISHLVSVPFTAATPETKPMFKIGGGIILGVTRTVAVEMGCRYQRIFTSEAAINMANIFGGMRVGF